jgi:potassium-transporting ATPase KdpC subunit
MLQQIAPALRMMIFLTVLTGLVYPGVITGLCQLLFRHQANGSLLTQGGRIIGSSLIGQNFSQPGYFHPRPSAAGSSGYDAVDSRGSNLGPTSQKLHDRVKASAAQFRKKNPSYSGPIPADALTTSGSGLDPDISPANAMAQAARIAKARGVNQSLIETLIRSETQERGFRFLGERRVNVLSLNLALNRATERK